MGATAQVAQGYARLASELVTRWGDHADAIATKVRAGNYGADDAVSDLAKSGFIAAESYYLVVNEAVEAIAICSGSQDQPYDVESEPFDSPLPGAALKLTDALSEPFGDVIPVGAVTVAPTPLAQGATQFRVRTNASGRPGTLYRGVVRASDAAGATADVAVRLVVA
jgi:hypothetical protein